MPLYEGRRITFDSSGIKREISVYNKDHVPEGDEYFFYSNGKTYLVLRHLSGTPINSSLSNERIVACYDSTGGVLVENGNGSFKLYDYSFKKIVETGVVKDGKRDGKCEGLADMRNGHFLEEYKDGRLISGVLIDSTRKAIRNYSDARIVEPTYPGGVKAFNKYLRRNMHYPKPDKENNISGVVLLNFIIERDGKVNNVRALNHVSPLIDAEAVRVMNSSPPWIPGSRYGLQVRVWYSIPIGFWLSGD